MLRKNTVVIEVTDDDSDLIGAGRGSNLKDSLIVPTIREENSDDDIEFEDEGG